MLVLNEKLEWLIVENVSLRLEFKVVEIEKIDRVRERFELMLKILFLEVRLVD